MSCLLHKPTCTFALSTVKLCADDSYHHITSYVHLTPYKILLCCGDMCEIYELVHMIFMLHLCVHSPLKCVTGSLFFSTLSSKNYTQEKGSIIITGSGRLFKPKMLPSVQRRECISVARRKYCKVLCRFLLYWYLYGGCKVEDALCTS